MSKPFGTDYIQKWVTAVEKNDCYDCPFCEIAAVDEDCICHITQEYKETFAPTILCKAIYGSRKPLPFASILYKKETP